MRSLVIFVVVLILCNSRIKAVKTEYRRHTNNWAVIVDTSRFWNNYRHIANALSLYHSVKRLGIPDSQIILMLADQMPCNARNCFPGQVFNSKYQKINLYGKNVEVDYRGAEVTVANFITVLTGRHEPGTPLSKRLDSDESSNIFIFMTGHGGDGFLKFQDYEELSSQDIADAIQEMYVKKRYNEIFFMVDTCQAGSLAKPLTSPHVVTIGSSLTGESSYAHHSDRKIGVAVIDRFTYATLDYLQKLKVGEDTIRDGTLQDLFQFFDPRMLYSTPDYRTELLGRSIDKVQITDFLGSILAIHLHKEEEAYPLYGFDQEEEEEEEEEAIKQETENDIEEFSFKSNHRSLNVSSNINLESEKKNPRVHIHEKFAFSQEFLIGCVIFVLSFITITSSHI